MNGAKKIITLIGIFIIAASVSFGAYMVYQKGLITTQSDPSIKPTKIKVTNISDDRFTISWVTASATAGSLIYGVNGKPTDIQIDDSDQLTGQNQPRKLHHITVTNLKPATQYAYRIRSGDKNNQFDDNGQPFTIKTAPTLAAQPASELISGTVIDSENKPATDAIVYITLAGNTPISTQVKNDGSWLVSLSSARNVQLTEYAKIDSTSTPIEIFIQGESLTSKGITNSTNFSPVPQITLGQAFDYTKEPETEVAVLPTPTPTPSLATESATIKPVTTEPIAAQFPVTAVGGPTESTNSATLESYAQDPVAATVTITYPSKDNEQITSLRPEFMGTGPASKILNLNITAAKPISSTVVVDRNGRWSYSPVANLSTGNHVISLDYTDSQGIQKKAKRSFVIASSSRGGTNLPAFEATPSATATPRPTVKPVRKSMPSTQSGIPQSGVSLPTVGLLTLGLLLFGSGIYAKALKSND